MNEKERLEYIDKNIKFFLRFLKEHDLYRKYEYEYITQNKHTIKKIPPLDKLRKSMFGFGVYKPLGYKTKGWTWRDSKDGYDFWSEIDKKYEVYRAENYSLWEQMQK